MTYRPILAVIEREIVRLFRQKSRLLSAMVRPMIWLFVIGAGFDAMLGQGGGSGGDGASYQYFLVPGVLGMSMLFGAMLAALATVYDKESGVMRMLVVAPFEHYWIVVAKTLSAAIAAAIQAVLVLILLALLGYLSKDLSPPLLVAGIAATSLASASTGMLIAACTKTLDNFAVMMNLVIFPMFFLSGSLYPIQHLPDALRIVAMINPYSYGVDLLKHALPVSGSVNFSTDFSLGLNLAVLLGFSALATAIACARFSRETAYEPLIHMLSRKRGE
ncbi:MAG: ABC transporter permease [Burkholderiales bacterium]|nr:ABC transporter permease [Burkholderiales bacterium]